MEAIFSSSGLLIMPFWTLKIFLPHWHWTLRIVRSPLVVLPPTLLYAALALPRLAEVFPAVFSPTLAGIAALLGTPAGATIAWAHFLAFDLFVGRWIYLDGHERGISTLLMGPVLFLTLILGPLGVLLYMVLRGVTALYSDARSRLELSTKEETGA